MRLVIGTRGSPLARWQAEHVAAALRRLDPALEVVLSIIVTGGDRLPQGSLETAGGKGLWVKEIEDALLSAAADLAVHSLKDVPAALAPGLTIAAIPERADPRDALVSRSGLQLDELPAGCRVGTTSLRRACQLRTLRPDVSVEPLRGNVDTRLRKIETGAVDAGVLACAGLDRLGHGARISERLSTDRMLPAIGQGALCLEARASDGPTLALCRRLADPAAEATVAAERALLEGLGAGCKTPVAGYAVVDGAVLRVRGLVGRPDGSEILRDEIVGPTASAAALGAALATRLLGRGADRILADF